MPLPQGPSQEQAAVIQPQTYTPANVSTQPSSPSQILPGPVTEKVQTTQKSVASTEQKLYVVQEGDSLSSIAKKVYGADAGNKLANLTRIFEVNRSTMKSPDELYVGQKLVIPALPTAAKTPAVLSGPQFVKVESIGARRTAETGGEKVQGARVYVVKEGDTLWKIAQQCLGDGNRYDEIAKLNAGTIADEDTLDVGMSLKLPAK
jgi:nucleoid-associated protein YgaU